MLRQSRLQDMDLHPGPERVEALLRLGREQEAQEVAREYHRLSTVKAQAWALARAERSLGMVAGDEEADAHFEEAAALHATTPDTFETARTLLAHGASLRRRRRRRDAREPLREALAAFEALGAEQRAEQAAVELAATGETVQRRGASRLTTLTAQERQIAELLGEGQTTRQAAAALFLSPKTVEYHLRHVYAKLGIRSRADLAGVLTEG
jgi:DNA-binding CsgD family transcriptional regulator